MATYAWCILQGVACLWMAMIWLAFPDDREWMQGLLRKGGRDGSE